LKLSYKILQIYDENSKYVMRSLNIKSISVGVFDIEVVFCVGSESFALFCR
jgi:hypothetical protein